jgi:hypothetical protein
MGAGSFTQIRQNTGQSIRSYRYGDSNPGFRTENCLCEAVCGRFVPVASKEISPVPSSSVESGTYFGTWYFDCRHYGRSRRQRRLLRDAMQSSRRLRPSKRNGLCLDPRDEVRCHSSK